MPTLQTALSHFNTDLARARALMNNSALVPACTEDMLRSALMFAVGACDAYFADSYADLLSRTLRAKELEPTVQLPNRLNNLKIPVTAMLRATTMPGWKWRMAARELVEKENVLSFDQIRGLFNQFFPKKNGLLSRDRVCGWMSNPQAKRRQFGKTAAEINALPVAGQDAAKERALEHFENKFGTIFQRRHDCIHCCDRPKVAIQAIKPSAVQKKIDDIEFLVNRCHAELDARFPLYLTDLGFGPVTRNQVSM
ncbi:hypothetical protein [Herbaspirillum sp. C9C3]|uniref:hypothetical protein n=1 Tax=Herbaspirillum sp. C9C3 TaxID=2735271 RepID=UPI001585D21F|nr:hypothetical protein [Herbaspirillum sp. C9C3]NUT63227.1 hypothetical protein [Herbaspirillum sp. C9C3]